MEFVQVTQDIESVFRQQRQWGGSAHEYMLAGISIFTIGRLTGAGISRNPIFQMAPDNRSRTTNVVATRWVDKISAVLPMPERARAALRRKLSDEMRCRFING